MALFDLPKRETNKALDSKLIAKIKNKQQAPQVKVPKSVGDSLIDKINYAKSMITEIFEDLGKFDVIRDEQSLVSYIDLVIKEGLASMDTETTGLNPMVDKVVGFSLYAKGLKAVYVPVNHIDYVTKVKVRDQISEKFVAEQLERLRQAQVRLIWFNAVFDIRFIKNTFGVTLGAYWDTYVAARLLDENLGDGKYRLKPLYTRYVLGGQESSYTFNDFFKGIVFNLVPINVGAPYASHDAVVTYELYDFQAPYLTPGSTETQYDDLDGVAYVFHNIEMPVINVVVAMEETGVAVDFDHARKLSETNTKLKTDLLAQLNNEVYKYKAMIDQYNSRFARRVIATPVNWNSPTQISALLYDVIGITMVDGRGTGDDILEAIDHPIANMLQQYRSVAKLLDTFIDKLPREANETTSRIHARFNQMGTDTGRFSSKDPNLQNIPNGGNVRQIIKATDGYCLLSSDYSAQEPRITAHMSGDQQMIQAYNEGKDLYVEIASLAFNVPYTECMEFRSDGSTNKEGKKRRGQAKAIVLGVCYGKGIPAIAKDLGITIQEAQEVYDKIMQLFPALEQFMTDSQTMARVTGYVTTVWGRKRRLPDINLPQFEIIVTDNYLKQAQAIDPLNFNQTTGETLSQEEFNHWYGRLMDTNNLHRGQKYKMRNQIKEEAMAIGLEIKDNGGFIAQAERQCVNSRIQGSAGDQTKLAMILIHNDPQMQQWGFRLLIQVHDELIGECPLQYRDLCAQRFKDLMIEAAKELAVPSDCDVKAYLSWDAEEIPLNIH